LPKKQLPVGIGFVLVFVFVWVFVLSLIPSLTELITGIAKLPGCVLGIALEVLSCPVSFVTGLMCSVVIAVICTPATRSQKRESDKNYRPE
jgi:membrane protein implicated in regulation of membrane protease activity